MNCRRPKCTRRARIGKDQGFCHAHYDVARRGYVDSGPCIEKIRSLREAGFGVREIEKLCGIADMRLGDRVQVKTYDRIMGVSVPGGKVDGGGRFPSLGSHRRIRGLMALGWTNRRLASEMGITDRRLSQIMRQPEISARNAKRISDVYDRLSMTLGPSNRSRVIAKRKGWAVPLAWDDDSIENPDAKPDRGARVPVPFPTLYRETVEHLGTRDLDRVAAGLVRSRDALDRQLFRYGLKHGEAA